MEGYVFVPRPKEVREERLSRRLAALEAAVGLPTDEARAVREACVRLQRLAASSQAASSGRPVACAAQHPPSFAPPLRAPSPRASAFPLDKQASFRPLTCEASFTSDSFAASAARIQASWRRVNRKAGPSDRAETDPHAGRISVPEAALQDLVWRCARLARINRALIGALRRRRSESASAPP